MTWKHHTGLALIVGLLIVSIVLLVQSPVKKSGGIWFQLKDAKTSLTLRLENNGVYFLYPNQEFNILIGTRQSRTRLPFVNVSFPDHWINVGGQIAATAKRSFDCVAPNEAGTFEIVVDYKMAGIQSQDKLLLVVMTNFTDVLNSYPRTYTYPDISSRQAPKWIKNKARYYQKPKYMFAVTPPLLELEIIPGYALKDFLCPSSIGQTSHLPYAFISPKLMEKLRVITLKFIKTGLITKKIKVLEGYRSPRYNASVKGASLFSRHIYGDAVTFIIDEDNDGVMDDINKDGQVDRLDAVILAKIIRNLEVKRAIPKGGIGITESKLTNSKQPVEIQIDCRGYSSVWGVSQQAGKIKNFIWWK